MCMPYGALLLSMQHDASITYIDPTKGIIPIYSPKPDQAGFRGTGIPQCMPIIWYPLTMLPSRNFTS